MQPKKHLEDYYRWTPKMDDLLQKHSEDYSKQSMDSEDGRLALEALEALDYADESPGALEVPDGRLQKRSMPAGLDYE